MTDFYLINFILLNYFKKVTKNTQIYLNKNEDREEGGTPPIVEAIRLGLLFTLKNSINQDVLMEQERKNTMYNKSKIILNIGSILII